MELCLNPGRGLKPPSHTFVYSEPRGYNAPRYELFPDSP
jgi:hypothetical protein